MKFDDTYHLILEGLENNYNFKKLLFQLPVIQYI